MSIVIDIDGNSLTCESLVQLSKIETQIRVTENAWKVVRSSRKVVDQMLERREVAYGINTGFGLFSDVVIEDSQLEKLQRNLIQSHSAGVGEPLTYERTRMLLAMRINVLCRGNSGISEETLLRMVKAFNSGCMSVVPQIGSVGASGDLAPLSHLALGLMGEGLMWDHSFDGSDSRKWPQKPAIQVLADHKVEPIQLGAKEGLALINGTQLITSLACEATFRAENVQRCADAIAALSVEVLKGTVNAFHPRIHERRPHRGQGMVAARLRALLHPGEASELFQSHKYKGRVQDAYSLRCTPQVHGIVADTIDFVRGIIETEANSSGDNPMVFAEDSNVTKVIDGKTVHIWPPKRMEDEGVTEIVDKEEITVNDLESAKAEISRLKAKLAEKSGEIAGSKRSSDTFYDTSAGFIISGGNFHGEYPAKAMDFLAIAVHEIASISERRIERLVNPSLSNLPAFLVENGGLNSGFMIAHCTAAALVSENKVLCHPASVDSISTSAGKEDHVSMGAMASRKAVQVLENVERVLAIELLAACQALEFHRPLRTTPGIEAMVALVRSRVKSWDEDRIMYSDIETAIEIITSGKLWETVSPHLEGFSGTCVN